MTSGSPPETDVACAHRWCAEKIAAHLREVLRVECDLADGQLTLYECYGPDWARTPIARLRYTGETGLWSLYARDRYKNFHRYQFLAPCARIQDILDYLDNSGDPIFWG